MKIQNVVGTVVDTVGVRKVLNPVRMERLKIFVTVLRIGNVVGTVVDTVGVRKGLNPVRIQR